VEEVVAFEVVADEDEVVLELEVVLDVLEVDGQVAVAALGQAARLTPMICCPLACPINISAHVLTQSTNQPLTP
jgi:hypothetical protein